MTIEEREPQYQLVPIGGDHNGSYVQFGVEGVPFSAVRVVLPLHLDMMAREQAIQDAVYYARFLADTYANEFHPERGAEPFRDDEPPWAQDDAPPFVPSSVITRPQFRAPMTGGPPQGPAFASNAQAWCPTHVGARMTLLDAKWNPKGDIFQHPLEQADWFVSTNGKLAKNCRKYWRETLDAQGGSNAQQLLPAGR